MTNQTIELIKNRRSRYDLSKTLPVSDAEFQNIVKDAIHWTPDAFNMNSARAIIVSGDLHETLWNTIKDQFDGAVTEERIAPFRAAYGTVLFFTDEATVKGLQEQFAAYAENFPGWANQSVGMAQGFAWTALAEAGIGANIQHYNPVIDEAVAKLLNVPAYWKLVSQMVVGGINSEPEAKDRGDINTRVLVK